MNGILEKARKPLKRGNIYEYRQSSHKIKISFVVFRGHEEDDGGMQGVGVDWIRNGKKKEGGFYACESDEEFFAMLIFSGAYDEPAPSVPLC